MLSRFPHEYPIEMTAYGFSGHSYTAADVLKHLAPRLTPERWEKIQRVVSQRTCDVTPVLENIYDRGNTSAVFRSAEAMGFQTVHLIEPSDRFKEANRVTAGADKWLDVIKFKKTADAVSNLKSKGYQVLATHLDARAKPLATLDLTKPTAIVFGNEKDGISQEMIELCDATVILPMRGFVQSYNISVAAAIAFQTIASAREAATASGALAAESLTENEKRLLEAHYCLRTLENPVGLLEKLVQRFG
ncbi:MAG: RNA methyltransferase [Bdellovibrionales bacterium]|nr:RNA methyltransferase [Bdellovibrionales bacterium]